MFTCRGCQQEFIPKRKGQEYHNRDCFRKSTIKPVICPECGIEFQKKFTGQVCCTPVCANKYRAKKLKKGTLRPCAYPGCTKQMSVMPSRIKDNNFCGREHRIAYLQLPENRAKAKEERHTPEEIEKIRQAGKGRKPTAENIEKLKEVNHNRIWTEEQREAARQRKLGKSNTTEQNRKIKEHAKYGIDNIMWVISDDEITYAASHLWAARHMTDPLICVDIADGILCKGRLELSNKDHKYRRVITDWKWRCIRHHRKYDKEHGLVNPKGKAKNFYSIAEKLPKSNVTINGMTVSKNDIK